MRGENVACSLGALHYIVAIVILLDSIIFMFGFPPFFITKLAPAAYYFIIIYSITAGSLFFCYPKLASIWNKNAMETIISRRQLRAYRRKRCFSQAHNSSPRTKDAQLEKVEQ
jgi:hypothetical protein